MDPITLRLEPKTVEELNDEYEERGFRNRTLYLRHLVDNRDVVFEGQEQGQGMEIEAVERLADHADRLEDLAELAVIGRVLSRCGGPSPVRLV